MAQLILGLGNKARHGKDSFAAAVIAYYANLDAVRAKHGMVMRPTVIQRHSFADALYKEVNEFLASDTGSRWVNGTSGASFIFLGLDGVRIPEWVTPVRIPEWVTPDKPAVDPRAPLGKHAKLLQWWGTEYRRSKDPNYWVNQWKMGINPKADIVFSTDMRFENEAAAVKDMGGYTVQVSRLNGDGSPFVDPSRDSLHVSETQLDGYNYDFKITVKTGDLVLLEDWAITLVHYLRALKGK
jgi:hypothetical protein